VHLNMAVGIYTALLLNGLTLVTAPVEQRVNIGNYGSLKKTRLWAVLLLHCLALNISSGSIVAGLEAWRVFNTWPLMNGKVVPSGYWKEEIGWRNSFENMASVQFNHRTLAYVTYIAAAGTVIIVANVVNSK
jgi:heme a synthase